MIYPSQKLPAWILLKFPVRWARRCIGSSANSPSLDRQANSQLLVDVSVIYESDSRTGIQRVVRALLLQLLSDPPSGYTIFPIFSTRRHGYRYADANFLCHVERPDVSAQRAVEVQSGDIFLGLDLAAHLLPRHQAEMLRWKRSGVKLHVLVYDLLPVQHPEWFNPRTERNFKRWIRWIAVYADNAICISDSVRKELHAWLYANFGMSDAALHMSTIVLGADIAASSPSRGLPNNAQPLLTMLHGKPTVLMVGTIEPRKGYDQALAAFECLWQEPDAAAVLVLVGRAGWKTESLQIKLRNHLEVGHRLFWLDNASDEFLTYLYATCSGVLIASHAEGFGLPLIEAVLHNKPILARDLPVFREIGAEEVTYFDTENPEELAHVLKKWLHIENLEQAKRKSNSCVPTWQLSASQLKHALGFKSTSEL